MAHNPTPSTPHSIRRVSTIAGVVRSSGIALIAVLEHGMCWPLYRDVKSLYHLTAILDANFSPNRLDRIAIESPYRRTPMRLTVRPVLLLAIALTDVVAQQPETTAPPLV